MMGVKKTSPIWTTKKEKLQEIVSSSKSIAEILRSLKIYTGGSNRQTLLKRFEKDNIDMSHIPLGLGSNKGKKFGNSPLAIPNEIIFQKDSEKPRHIARRRILRDNLIPYTCAECGTEPMWRNKKLTLVLDHINGIPNDHRLENLRFLCPNCNSQTDTFCGKNALEK
jgi:predicted RNA-binding Zn-ribbon protein involved in translation (DUF1610 family)